MRSDGIAFSVSSDLLLVMTHNFSLEILDEVNMRSDGIGFSVSSDLLLDMTHNCLLYFAGAIYLGL